HTYEGITGAQVGYLLRRWQYARKRNGKKGNLCIVGLSATLTNPETFFSKLTGLDFQKGQVAYVAPREEDLEEQGMEYNIVLKGNPAAATSLLSTSVQTMMLLGRMQDSENIANHREKTVSLGSFGRKVFGFTDNLDVINRWFYIQYDAEQRKQLAQFRDVNQIQSELGLHEAQLATVSEQGQIWSAAGIIGHELQNGLRIGRTSSQDRGYDVDAELIIASSTLEVGFNDKRVGAVVQHKAPRSMASFLQRKGRAGRTRSMRPWLAVVTSAYGRDRWAFQHATALFNPKLAATQLPLTNDYVRKIQAAYVLMDWLALKLKLQRQNADLWSALNSNQQKQNVERTQSRRHWENQHRRLVALLTGILNGRYLNKFQTYLQEALRLDVQDIHIVLWRQPRSILFSVIPTALRQLETQWQAFDINGEPEKWIDRPASTPLPDFVPAALFSDLNLPELTLQLPPTFNQEEEDTVETMALLQGMREFAPARANKRFMLAHHADIAHWLNVPDTDPETHQLDLLDWEAVEVEGRVAVESGGVTYAVFRPIRYHLTEVPSHIRSTSYSELRWRSSFLPQTASLSSGNRPIGKQIDLPAGSQWSRLISTIDLYTQADGAWVEVNRLADCVQIETKYKDGTTMRRLVKFVVEDGQSAALGFNLAVDALRFRFVPPDFSQLQAHPDWGNIYRSLRSRYFFDVLKQDVRLNDLSVFEIEWLWQLELSLLTMIAIEQQCSLATAAQIAQTQRFERTNTVFDHIFQAQQIDDEGDDVLTSRLQERLEEHLQNPIVIQVLKEAAVALWSPNQQAFEAWLTDCYASSLGATLFNVVVRLVPDIEPDDLVMDIDTGCIWISEKSLGGIGLITRIADEISQYPRRFELQLLDTLAYCEREQLAGQLDDVTGLISSGNHDLQTAFSIVRTETDLPTLLQTQTILRQIFESNGIPATRQLFVEMNSKFLRPNSAEDSDQLVSIFTDQWRREEQRLDIDIDLRVMAVAGSQIKVIQAQVQTVMQRLGGRVDDQSQVFNLLQSLLWLNCHDSCPDCIQTWNPYQPQTHPSRPLIAMMLQPYGRIVRFGEAYWETTGQDSLREHFQVEIRCDVGEINACKIALLNWLVSPIDIGFQTFYPVIERIERLGQDWRLHLIIQELVGA
ncbi:MAG: protein DpdJ, partial [Candidatus Promineifilaceae bacterium]